MDSKVKKDSGFTLVPSATPGAMKKAPQETDDWVLATLGRLPPFLVDTISSYDCVLMLNRVFKNGRHLWVFVRSRVLRIASPNPPEASASTLP